LRRGGLFTITCARYNLYIAVLIEINMSAMDVVVVLSSQGCGRWEVDASVHTETNISFVGVEPAEHCMKCPQLDFLGNDGLDLLPGGQERMPG